MKKFIINKVAQNYKGELVPVKTKNKYMVINIDEPYARNVFEIIKANEKYKGIWDAPDNFEEFIKLL